MINRQTDRRTSALAAALRVVVALTLGGLLLGACSRQAVQRPAPSRTSCLRGVPVMPDPARPTLGMVHIRGARFNMGAVPVRPEEGPAHSVRVAGFWIDPTDVTNAQFARFVTATGYRTLAERPLDGVKYPGLTQEQRRPASLVFVGAKGRVDLNDPSQWWRVMPGANWRHPWGPDSTIEGLGAFPVVHVAYEDALAYAHTGFFTSEPAEALAERLVADAPLAAEFA